MITYTDGGTQTIDETPETWEHEQKAVMVGIKSTKSVKSAKINGGIFMDADESDNQWTAK